VNYKKWPPVLFLILVFDILAIVLLHENNSSQIPAILISSVALGFSYYAYRFSKEKFRLDLLDRRWEIYEQALTFCSVVVTHAGLPKHGKDERINKSIVLGLEAAHDSFRGIGLHKTTSLFGSEVHEKFNQLNKMYAWLVAQPRNEGWVEEEYQNLSYILKTIEELPTLFKPYVYFGDYKD
jgi:hypothetical protein